MQCAFLHVSALPIRPARFTNRRMKRLCKMCLSRSQAWTFPAALTAVVVSVLYQLGIVRLITRLCESAELPFRCCPPRPVRILNWKRHCHGFHLSRANNIHPVPVPSGWQRFSDVAPIFFGQKESSRNIQKRLLSFDMRELITIKHHKASIKIKRNTHQQASTNINKHQQTSANISKHQQT